MRESWPHAPPHYFTPHGTYIVSAATLHRKPLFDSDAKLDLLRNTTFEFAGEYGLFCRRGLSLPIIIIWWLALKTPRQRIAISCDICIRVVGRVTPCTPLVELGMRRAEDCPPYLQCYGARHRGLKATRDPAL
jgi:hypothetical protein